MLLRFERTQKSQIKTHLYTIPLDLMTSGRLAADQPDKNNNNGSDSSTVNPVDTDVAYRGDATANDPMMGVKIGGGPALYDSKKRKRISLVRLESAATRRARVRWKA
jgi:hypothetical protein